MKLVVTLATIDANHGGPARSVPALCRALVTRGVDVQLVTIAENDRSFSHKSIHGFKATVINAHGSRYEPRSWMVPFKNALTNALRGGRRAILYDVGMWLPSNHFAAQAARRNNATFVASPRGMLSDYAWRRRRWKKRLAWLAYQSRDLQNASVLHATSDREAQDFRNRGLRQPIAVIPNGVETPCVWPRRESHGGVRTVLFLSRLHPMKGLKDLVNAWVTVKPKGWRVIVAGPDESGHRREIEFLLAEHDLGSAFVFIGPTIDEEKWKLFASADLFVLPSYSESFGLAIAEALAAGVPVITTHATPWEQIREHRCGWWVPVGHAALTAALGEATRMSTEALREMGSRGRDFVAANYSWPAIADRMYLTFQWAMSGGHRPAWIT